MRICPRKTGASGRVRRGNFIGWRSAAENLLMGSPMKRILPVLAGLLLPVGLLSAAPLLVYVGGFTSPSSRGIFALRFDAVAGTLSPPILAVETNSPTWLALDPSRRHLYAVDSRDGPVSAFAVDAASGRLTLLNQRATGGPGGSSVAQQIVDGSGRMLIVADYAGGAICTYPIEDDGSLGERTARIALTGPPGPIRKRQSHSYPHSVALSPDSRFAFACDRGLDRIFIYQIDAARARLTPAAPPFVVVYPGAGPRHAAFSADSRFFYLLNELGNSICAYAYDAGTGHLALLQNISTLPPNFSGESLAGEIAIHPNGRFVYVTNRDPGTDNLTVFARDPQTGRLKMLQSVTSEGDIPRNFALSPDGRWLLCVNQETNNVAVFGVDPPSGRLASAHQRVAIEKPMCVIFCPP